MKIDDIKSAICKWISSKGFTAIQMPSNHPAPKGQYFAVSVPYVSQYGSMTTPAPAEGANRVVQYVATISVHEIEGCGDDLRKFRNDFDGEGFKAFISNRFQDDSGEDTAFAVWDIGDINELDQKDGDFYVRQQVFNFRVCFNDFIEFDKSKVLSVEGTIGADDFNV